MNAKGEDSHRGREQKVKDSFRSIILYIQESFYEKVRLVGQGTFGKVYLVNMGLLRRKERKIVESGRSKKCFKTADTRIVN